MTRYRILTVTVLAMLCALASVAPASADPAPPKLPVVYDFFSGIPAELARPGGSLPGSNDWTCKPSPQHPNPVVLVHGTGGGAQTNWGVYVPLLANEGYCVYSFTYGANTNLPWPLSAIGGLRSMTESAGEMATFVDRVLASTGAAKVDIVGHSQGTLMPTYYVKHLGGANKIGKYVSLAPLWNGSNTAFASDLTAFADRLGVGGALDGALAPFCGACTEVLRGSPFLDELRAGSPYEPSITYTNIMTRYDEAVVPYTSGYLPAPNATNIVVQDGCASDYSEHAGLAGSPRAAAFVLNALDPANPRPVPCEFIPPFAG